MKFDKIDLAVIHFIQGDLPLQSRPYQQLAGELGIAESEIVEKIEQWQAAGVVRRLAAVLRHQKAGYEVNAMVAWKVGLDEADLFAAQVIDKETVSHCYWRQMPKDFEFNLFTMIHCRCDEEMAATINEISIRTGVTEYVMLKSIKEFKKSSMKYF